MPGVISVGKRYPLLSLVLVKEPHILPDNIHYAEQMECYKQCLCADPSFKSVVQHDLAELKKRLPNVESKEKLQVQSLPVKELSTDESNLM